MILEQATQYGDERGGHVKVFVRPLPMGRGMYFDAYYYGGAGLGVCLDAVGYGATPDEAFKSLWRNLQ